MRSTNARTSPASPWERGQSTDPSETGSRSEQGRRAILAGWLVTMAGIAGYIAAMSRAGENADITDGLLHQGPLGWISGALMLVGVVTWFIGNYACLQDGAEIPASREE
ncbi:MAG: hypothetical protein ACM3SS_08995 [Rhodospirillaceae bacterium]